MISMGSGSALRLTGLGLTFLALASCGGGGGGPAAPSPETVLLSEFRVRPLTSVITDRVATLEITVVASDPQRLIGTQAFIRKLQATQVRQGQTQDPNPIIATLDVLQSNLQGQIFRLLMTVTLSRGTSKLRFGMASPELLLAQRIRSPQTAAPVQTNTIDFEILARDPAPDPAPAAAPPAPPALPTVTVTANDPNAAEPSDPGSVSVSRTGSTAAPLTVLYTVGGTATAGSDYTALSGSVTIPAGSASATITVTPINDTVPEPPETVIVTPAPNPAYVVGPPASATVTIADDDLAPALPTVTIAATDPAAAENASFPDVGVFTVSRTGSTAGPLTVPYTVGGTATAGSDYTALSGSVTIPAGSASATITVTPIDDAIPEPPETVVVTLSANPASTLGAPSSATVTITSDDPFPVVTISAGSPIITGCCTLATFAVTRSIVSATPLTVAYSLACSPACTLASNPLPTGTITIPGGGPSAAFSVATSTPGSFTATASLVADPAYTVGSQASAMGSVSAP